MNCLKWQENRFKIQVNLFNYLPTETLDPMCSNLDLLVFLLESDVFFEGFKLIRGVCITVELNEMLFGWKICLI